MGARHHRGRVLITAVGQTYRYQMAAIDADRNHLQFALESGPGGMVIDHENGQITWIPLPGSLEQAPVKVRVYEDVGNWVTQEFVLAVTDANHPPVLQPIGNRRVQPGRTVTFTLAGSDPEGAGLTYYATNLPIGATFDPVTRKFIWTPTEGQSGFYTDLLFAVSDGTREDHEFVAITVGESAAMINSAPVTQFFDTLNIPATLSNSGPVNEGSPVRVTFFGPRAASSRVLHVLVRLGQRRHVRQAKYRGFGTASQSFRR